METGSTNFIALVAIPGVPMLLSYGIPQELAHITVGFEVEVELGKRRAFGWVTKVEEKTEPSQEEVEASPALLPEVVKKKPFSLRPLLSGTPVFQPADIRLFEWMTDYYGAVLADVLQTSVPRRKELRTVLHVQLAPDAVTSDEKRSGTKQKILDALAGADPAAPLPVSALEELIAASGSSIRNALKQLETNGCVTLTQQPIASEGLWVFIQPKSERQLTEQQKHVLEKFRPRIAATEYSASLLFGVTGSGKTEIYLQAIEQTLELGKTAIVLVPEIALTSQLIEQLARRFGGQVALLHSEIGDSLRWKAWKDLLDGTCRIAVGARSAIFAPLSNIGLIVVDEEHESSYKQSEGLRYHARDVAVVRAQFHGCPVLLGSATPSFESLVNVQRTKYHLLELSERVTNRPLPQIEVVDLSTFKRSEMPSENISPRLFFELKKTLEHNQQAIILYNRRGFASFLQCESCHETMNCPHCSVSLTFHQKAHKLLCHFCGLTMTPPPLCIYCRDPRIARLEPADPAAAASEEEVGKLRQRGGGTERVVEELAELFPGTTVVRMDRDTVGKRDSYDLILGAMKRREANILVGTQMIAKGHDIPGVTLVGIIDADVGLHLPDFRTSERAFQLITQVAGRAGRGAEQGRVILQTRQPNHPTIVATVTGRFRAFARHELDYRKSLNYPPWGKLLRVLISSPDRREAQQAAGLAAQRVRAFQESLAQADTQFAILGPAPAPHERLRDRYRFHILVKAGSSKRLSQLASDLHRWRHQLKNFRDIRIHADVDPHDML